MLPLVVRVFDSQPEGSGMAEPTGFIEASWSQMTLGPTCSSVEQVGLLLEPDDPGPYLLISRS